MPSKGTTVADRVGDWLTAYNAVRYELTPDALRAMTDLTRGDPGTVSITAINIGLAVSRIVFANDRAAAITAAMLTQSGISRPVIATDGIEE